LLLAAAIMVAAGCSSTLSAGFPKPPRFEPVGATVLVSADGRVITAVGKVVCGHAQRLVARSYPTKVVLVFENPDRNCHAEEIQRMPASTRLAVPLGSRALVRAGSTKATIPQFSERHLARVRRLPFGLRLSGDGPADASGPQGQAEIGDTRTYMSPKAIMVVTQIIPSPSLSDRRYWFSASCPIMFGWRPRHGSGRCRTVTWVTHGYHFLLGMAVEHGLTLSVQQLRMIAEGVMLSPDQYR
jgi:hypothetical protein